MQCQDISDQSPVVITENTLLRVRNLQIKSTAKDIQGTSVDDNDQQLDINIPTEDTTHILLKSFGKDEPYTIPILVIKPLLEHLEHIVTLVSNPLYLHIGISKPIGCSNSDVIIATTNAAKEQLDNYHEYTFLSQIQLSCLCDNHLQLASPTEL